MKKKIVFVMAVLGMAFANVQVNAQNERVRPPRGAADGFKNASIKETGQGTYSCMQCNFFGACDVVNCAG